MRNKRLGKRFCAFFQLTEFVLLTPLCLMHLQNTICVVVWENLVPLHSGHRKSRFTTCRLKLERQLGGKGRYVESGDTWQGSA